MKIVCSLQGIGGCQGVELGCRCWLSIINDYGNSLISYFAGLGFVSSLSFVTGLDIITGEVRLRVEKFPNVILYIILIIVFKVRYRNFRAFSSNSFEISYLSVAVSICSLTLFSSRSISIFLSSSCSRALLFALSKSSLTLAVLILALRHASSSKSSLHCHIDEVVLIVE